MLEAAALLIFPMMMAFAGTSDLLTMTISNRVSIVLILGFAVMAWGLGLSSEVVLNHVTCALLVLSITFAMFCFGWIGGGDAKLASTTALWIGWSHVMDYTLLASVIGGALTLFLIQVRRVQLPAFLLRAAFVARLHDPKSGVPYGIALAIAGLMIYPETIVWLHSIGAHGLDLF